jgi:hypothetical protein
MENTIGIPSAYPSTDVSDTVTEEGVAVVLNPPDETFEPEVVLEYPRLPLNTRIIFLLVSPFMPVRVVPASAGSVITL